MKNIEESKAAIVSGRVELDDVPLFLGTGIHEYLDKQVALGKIGSSEINYVAYWFSLADTKWGIQFMKVPDPLIKSTWTWVKFWNDPSVDSNLHPSSMNKQMFVIEGHLFTKCYNWILELRANHGKPPVDPRAQQKRSTLIKFGPVGKTPRRSPPAMGPGAVKKPCRRMVSEMGDDGSDPGNEVGEFVEEENEGE
jgi:hypothetical protein